MRWDPPQYARYAEERARPFLDLLGRVEAQAPRRVIDLGCGPGNLTAVLAQRWPDAIVTGVDSSPDMIDAARGSDVSVEFELGDVAEWAVPADADVVISNAMLQWVPGHLELLAGWARALPAGGWLAVQVPGNFDSPSHTIMRELAADERFAEPLAGVLRHHDAVASPPEYARTLLDAELRADVWETTYLHLLPGRDPVLEWLRGTGLRPVLAALPAEQAAVFEREFAARLRVAYPETPNGTFLPYRRLFAVGTKR